MRVVIDTNVIAYRLIRNPEFFEEVREFWRCVTEALAPQSWEAELGNALWVSARTGIVAPEVVTQLLDRTGRLAIRSVPVRTLWGGATKRALRVGLTFYDALFVELAERRGLPLATFDQAILRACPEIAARPRVLMG
ncbi:MAG: type II toxin-antitoxin system VapC family toxin [Myxococcales bacterium]|nr:type II toxin-antitoxin system VapC family toxin [Myxococcales bacterium]